MSTQITQILALSDAVENHTGLSHWSVSMRICGKGNQIKRLRDGADIGTKTAERLISQFADIWPDDLEWPVDIPRPQPKPKPVKGKVPS